LGKNNFSGSFILFLFTLVFQVDFFRNAEGKRTASDRFVFAFLYIHAVIQTTYGGIDYRL
jgi:hypothetical protein